MKIAFSSDNHLDLNKIDPSVAMHAQALSLVNEGIDVYVIAGDLFNDFNKTLAYARQMQDEVGNLLKVRFIVGNHDMNGVTYDELESDVDETYLHHKTLELTPDISLIANNGWYDYGYVGNDYTTDEILSFKNAFWYDRRIIQPMSDAERFEIVAQQIQDDLKTVGNKQTIIVNHFVPRFDYIKRFPGGNKRLDMTNAFMGSPRLGEMADQSYTIATVFGHLHLHPSPMKIGNNTYYNTAVGYHTSRTNEWTTGNDFITEWRAHLVILEF
jgi:putative phosphoesterase